MHSQYLHSNEMYNLLKYENVCRTCILYHVNWSNIAA